MKHVSAFPWLGSLFSSSLGCVSVCVSRGEEIVSVSEEPIAIKRSILTLKRDKLWCVTPKNLQEDFKMDYIDSKNPVCNKQKRQNTPLHYSLHCKHAVLWEESMSRHGSISNSIPTCIWLYYHLWLTCTYRGYLIKFAIKSWNMSCTEYCLAIYTCSLSWCVSGKRK